MLLVVFLPAVVIAAIAFGIIAIITIVVAVVVVIDDAAIAIIVAVCVAGMPSEPCGSSRSAAAAAAAPAAAGVRVVATSSLLHSPGLSSSVSSGFLRTCDLLVSLGLCLSFAPALSPPAAAATGQGTSWGAALRP